MLQNPKFTKTKLYPEFRRDFRVEDTICHYTHECREGGVKEPFLKDKDWCVAGIQLLCCRGVVMAHRDSWELPTYDYHLVIHNTGFIVRSPFEEASLMDVQEIGTLIRFRPHKLHTLAVDSRIPAEFDGVGVKGFATIHFGSNERLSMDAAMKEMCARMNRLQESSNWKIYEEAN